MRGRRVHRRAAAAAGAAVLAAAAGALAAAPAVAGDAALVRAAGAPFLSAEIAAGSIGPPDATQRAYDRARDLQEALRRAGPSSDACRPLHAALRAYAAGRVLQAEGIDRPSRGDVAAGRARALRARAAVRPARARCPGTGRGPAARPALPMVPAAGGAFFGVVVARAPRAATGALIDGGPGPAVRAPVRAGRVRARVGWPPGRYAVRVRFLRGGRTAGAVVARGAWLLPRSAAAAAAAPAHDAALTRAVARALAGGGVPAHAAAWVQDLRTGRVGHVNAGARFPAASTVKLGLLVGALRRIPGSPLDSPHLHDLRALAGWSSNLASNRLLRRFGAGAAADGLRRLGARRSTFTGEYIVGTSLRRPPVPSATAQPPLRSRRVTTAADLASMMARLHDAAAAPSRRRATVLTAHRARLALGWLLASQQRGDNAGLFGAGPPIAQKNGWLDTARLGAAIAYGPRGPVLIVLATQDDAGVSLRRARAVGARLAAVAAGAGRR